MDALRKKNITAPRKPEKKPKRHVFHHILLLAVFLICVGIGNLIFKVYHNTEAVFGDDPAVTSPALLADAKSILKEGDGRINVLFLGIDSPHKFSSRTDTIIFVSVNPDTGHTAMFSIPRDLWVPYAKPLKKGTRINHVFSEANKKKRDSGLSAVKDVVEDLFDVNVHYGAVINWEGFVKFIDAIGGVTVDVPYTLSDGKIYIPKGVRKLNGEKSLDFVRCRKGSCRRDFGRNERQQLLIRAVVYKLKRQKLYSDPIKTLKILDIVGKNVKTDVPRDDIEKLLPIMPKVNVNKIESITLSDGYYGELRISWENPYGYVLKPKNDDFTEIRNKLHSILKDPLLEKERAKIELQNGTNNKEIILKLAGQLKAYGYNIIRVKQLARIDLAKTRIIDYSGGKKPYTIRYLELRFKVKAEVLPKENKSSPDIEIKLGSDYKF